MGTEFGVRFQWVNLAAMNEVVRLIPIPY